MTRSRQRLVTVEISLPGCGTPIHISSLYAPPAYPNGPLDRQLLDLALSHPRSLLLGDLNARHEELGCRQTNVNGRLLLTALDDLEAVVLNDPQVPTFYHVSYDFRDCLDWAIASPGLVSLFRCSVGEDVGSDHRPILLFSRRTGVATSGHTQRNTSDPPPPRWRTTNPETWPAYQTAVTEELLNRRLLPASMAATREQLEDRAQAFEEAIQSCLESHFPRIKPPDPRGPRLPRWIIFMIKERRRLRRQQDRRPEDATVRRQVNELTASIRRAITDHRDSVQERTGRQLALGPRGEAFWPTLKKVLASDSRDQPPLPLENPLEETEPAITPTQRAEAFASHLESTMSGENSPDFDPVFFSDVSTTVANDHRLQPTYTLQGDEDTSWCEVSEADVEAQLARLRPNKAPGPDGIDTNALRYLPAAALPALASLFTSSLLLGHVPTRWKVALIRMLPKSGKPLTRAAHFRPIALTSAVGKLLDAILARRLLRFAVSSNLIPPHQSAFQSGRGTAEQISIFCQRTAQSTNHGLTTVSVALDIKGAFDSVWHDGLVHSCTDVLPLPAVRWIRSFLHQRRLQVQERTCVSPPVLARSGVPQGSPLSPLLYILYTRGMPEPSGALSGASTYADDVCLWTAAPQPGTAWSSLRPTLEAISSWCSRWRLRICPEKTQLAFFSRRTRWPDSAFPPVTFLGRPLEWRKSTTLLGVEIDRELQFAPQARSLQAQLGPRILQLRQLMWAFRRTPTWIGALVYKVCLRPVLLYSAPALAAAPPTVWRTLDRLERRGLRAALRAGLDTPIESLYHRARIRPLKEAYEDACRNFLLRARAAGNQRLLETLRPLVTPRRDLAFWIPPLDAVIASLPPADAALFTDT